MPNTLTVAIDAKIKDNILKIDFGDTAIVEFVREPEVFINKQTIGFTLDLVLDVGVILSKDSLEAFVPWANIKALII